jgi:sulfate adenylyltransferase subunit 2
MWPARRPASARQASPLAQQPKGFRMNARTSPELLQPMSHHPHIDRLSNTHLDALEEETIFILREVAAAFERPTLLFSGGKDSLVMLKCAEKAFGHRRSYPLPAADD